MTSKQYAVGMAGVLVATLGACIVEPDPSGSTAQDLDSCDSDTDGDGLADCEDPTPDCFTITGHVGEWDADGTADATIGPDGVWLGGPAAYTTGVDGTPASAFAFDGATRVDASPLVVGPSAPWTVSFWVKAATATQPLNTGVFASGTTAADTFQIDWASGGYYRFKGGAGALTFRIGAASTTDYQHLVIVYDGATGIEVYLDDELVARKTWPGGPLRITRARIGTNRGASLSFRGAIDDVRIWSRRLIASEVDSLYTSAGAGVCD